MTEFEKYSVAIQLVVAFGTIVVAVVAIWGNYLRSIFASPRLDLRLYNAAGEPTKYDDGSNVRYYHLAVSNKRNWAPAKNVVVHITLLERPGPDGEWRPAMYSGAVPLVWQFGQFYAGLPSIGREHICDLGRIAEGGQFKLKTLFRPNNFVNTIGAGEKARVHLRAVADNAQSNPLVIEVAWDGK
jgi:hypothetical protein